MRAWAYVLLQMRVNAWGIWHLMFLRHDDIDITDDESGMTHTCSCGSTKRETYWWAMGNV